MNRNHLFYSLNYRGLRYLKIELKGIPSFESHCKVSNFYPISDYFYQAISIFLRKLHRKHHELMYFHYFCIENKSESHERPNRNGMETSS